MHDSPRPAATSYRDGRDELNLADFPISVLQRQQPVDERGAKVDTAVYEARRYDRRSRQQVQQKVTLETSSRHGLPTPADENVVLALLYVAKHTHNFTDPVVPFAPRQLFDIMGWAPNSRSYDRLRDVLRRLQALVIRYENSWWDIEGRGYEAEVATGILSEYELGRQVSGRAKGKAPSCWVCWTPHFHRSLSNGNLKKLDLDRLFALKLPTAQRMYRFLDKRFYPPSNPPEVDMEVTDFACGHIGLTRVENVAELKRRLTPAIKELEGIGYIAPADPKQRFYKVRAGVWRVKFSAGPVFMTGAKDAPVVMPEPLPAPTLPAPEAFAPSADDLALVHAFYGLWTPAVAPAAGENDLRQARAMNEAHGPDRAKALLPALVQVLRRRWPDCKSFSGAAAKYLPDAVKLDGQAQRRQASRTQAQAFNAGTKAAVATVTEDRQAREARWTALPAAERQAIEAAVLTKHPHLTRFPALLRELCVNTMGERPA